MEEAETYANEINVSLIMTSSRTGEGTKELVEEIIKLKNEYETISILNWVQKEKGNISKQKLDTNVVILVLILVMIIDQLSIWLKKEKMKLWYGFEIKEWDL